MARIEPQKPDQTFNRSREIQREVLAYLKEYGPLPYDALYVHFDPTRTPEIQAVVDELIQWKFIERGHGCVHDDYRVRHGPAWTQRHLKRSTV